MESITFNQKEIEEMKELVSDKEIIDEEEIEELQKKLKKRDNLTIAKLYISCYNLLCINISQLGKNQEKLCNYLKNLDCEGIYSLMEDYKDGKDFGDYYIEQKIKDYVIKNRIKMEGLISLFFRIFGVEI